MTKQEIKDLINKRIKGQGTAIDAGSVMPSILEGIIDLIPSEGNKIFTPLADWEAETITMQNAITKYGLTDEVWGAFLSGSYNGTEITVTENENEVTKTVLTREIYTEVPIALEYDKAVVFGNAALRIKHTLDGNYIISFS